MNIPEIGRQISPYLIKLAESPPVQAEIEAVKAAIISIVENQSISIFTRIMRWIIKKIKGDDKMGNVNITVKNSEGVALQGVAISYEISGIGTTTTLTDVNGLVSVAGLADGAYKFVAALVGYNSGKAELTVTEGATVEGVITLVATAINTVEQTIASAITAAESNTTTTVSDDWKTIKAAAETALSGLSTSVANSDLTSSTVLTDIYSQITTVIQTAIGKVDAYKHELMVSRHSKDFWECVLIDAKLAGITVFEYFVSKEINKIKSEIESKIATF
ncbi:hypothetical protein Ga0466249_002309 [Sporomusaceae bacterium BoRhaA]|uniref:carboxypeptidase-like regulatory domain-containing protein n=1 Tax=Pelorhabdus rhamnosifermentans TaxID=2772457 RepID=UPI001C062F63|nr:carboxypeptidase-like regulatory domain-containing protein [Pelorhabdus rhamnosifermentans]MBU2701195.1 hypothetical protein [Pelorhabdus rhamnosifermentans]